MLGKSHPLMGSTGKKDISKMETWIKCIQSEMQTGKNDVCVRVYGSIVGARAEIPWYV